MKKKQPYCLMPWIHFHVAEKGTVKACCVANIPFGNVNNESFDQIWKGEPIKKLRDKFAKGISDPRCVVCINREKGGAKSIRQETHERFSVDNLQEIIPPVYFDIRFSNVCNFRCRTCWHGASSKWFKDAKALKRNLGEKAIIQNVHDFHLFIDKLGDALKNAKEIYFAGGEPLVTEEHYLLLEWFIKNKSFPILRYNTNFSVLNFKKWNVLKLWKHFPKVEILASIDAAGKLGEYIRKELDWDIFLKNREKIRGLKNVEFKISPTVSVLNIADLPDFYTYCVKLKIIEPQDWYMNLLERPYYYNIKSLEDEQKQKVKEDFFNLIEKVNRAGYSEIRNQFQSCIDFLFSENLSKHQNAFYNEKNKIDKLRNESSFF